MHAFCSEIINKNVPLRREIHLCLNTLFQSYFSHLWLQIVNFKKKCVNSQDKNKAGQKDLEPREMVENREKKPSVYVHVCLCVCVCVVRCRTQQLL